MESSKSIFPFKLKLCTKQENLEILKNTITNFTLSLLFMVSTTYVVGWIAGNVGLRDFGAKIYLHNCQKSGISTILLQVLCVLLNYPNISFLHDL